MGAHGVAALPQIERRAGRAARLVVEHPPHVAVVGHEGGRVAPQRLLLEDRPVREHVPTDAVAAAAACLPLLAIVRHARRRAMQHVREPLLLPDPPALGAPALALERLLHEPLAPGAIAPPAEVEAPQ